ncbi:MAG: DUF4157 domain-containing protein [Actinomycetota bacterium]
MHEHLESEAAVPPVAERAKARASGPAAEVLRLQRAAGNASVAGLLSGEQETGSPVKDVVGHGGGRALPDGVRAAMEHRLGADFSGVRVHDDAAASRSAQAVQAHAYTVGNDIVFQSGTYQPESPTGQRMIAHELTHVVQQRSGPVDGSPAEGGIKLSHPDDRFEQAAEASADAVMAEGPAVQRQEEGEEAEGEQAP